MEKSKLVKTVEAVCRTNIAKKGDSPNMLLTKFDDIIFNRPNMLDTEDFVEAIKDFTKLAKVSFGTVLDYIESSYDLAQRGKISADIRGSVKGGKLTAAKVQKIVADNIQDKDFQELVAAEGLEEACKAYAETVTYESLGDNEADRIHDESKEIRKDAGKLFEDFQL